MCALCTGGIFDKPCESCKERLRPVDPGQNAIGAFVWVSEQAAWRIVGMPLWPDQIGFRRAMCVRLRKQLPRGEVFFVAKGAVSLNGQTFIVTSQTWRLFNPALKSYAIHKEPSFVDIS